MNALETETCSRCGGSGHYSRCEVYGTTCFRCSGRKLTYTKRGHKALQYLTALRSKPAREVKVGDVIRLDYVGNVRFATVTKIGEATYKTLVNEEWVTPNVIAIHCGEYGLNATPDTMVRVAQSPEQKEASLKLALEFQGTLTKAGTVRKVSVPKTQGE